MKIIAIMLVCISLLMPMNVAAAEVVDTQEDTAPVVGIVDGIKEILDPLIEVDLEKLPIDKLPVDKLPIKKPVIEEPIIKRPIIAKPISKYNSHVIYANWSDDARIMNNALNAGSTNKNSLAIYRLDDSNDVANFKNMFSSTLSFSAYDSLVAKYNEDFFASRSLVLVYVPANSGSTRYNVSYAGKDGDTFVVEIGVSSNPAVGTCDMSGWFAIVEVSDNVLDSCTSYDAHRVVPFIKRPLKGIVIKLPKIGKFK